MNQNNQKDLDRIDRIPTEVTPLTDCDFLYVVDRTKDSFTFPVHRHAEFEINFVENCAGARRVVGDSIEEVGLFDLCIVGHGIEHGWQQHNCNSGNIREITIQFPVDIFGNEMLRRTQMQSVKTLLEKAAKGVTFPLSSILKIYHHIEELINAPSSFYQMMKLIEILHLLAIDPDGRQLSSGHESEKSTDTDSSRRLRMAQEYIAANYRKEIRLTALADMAGMSPSSFSRFFKLRTGRSISDYIIGIRLDAASRELVNTRLPISEICYNSGFNNVSNFNRIFKKNKGYTPKEFREIYKRNKIIV
ncbi:MAG: AraC family transcriptional regulator [Muribaculaceae bacterium]|nr:AraC family transcriptional regulator [Muribaculaceae bacterium]